MGLSLTLILLLSAGAAASDSVTAVGSGEDRYRQGDFTAALAAADFALEERPEGHAALNLKARALIGLRRFPESRDAAIAVLKDRSNDADALKSYAFSALHMGAVPPAKNSTALLKRIAPNDPQVYVLSALIAERQGAKRQLREDLQWAARLDAKRYKSLQAASESGRTLFDPADPYSHLLLHGLPEKKQGGLPWKLVLLGVVAVGLIGVLFHFAGPTLEDSPVVTEPSPVSAGARMISGEVENPYALKPPEKLLAGRYRLDYPIGRGGMGRVWEGIDRGAADRKIAVKQMSELPGERGTKMRSLYLKEAKLLEGLNHPNIVRLLDTLDLPEGVHLVFEFVSGKTFQQLLAERQRMPWPELKSILIPTALGLSYAHQKGLVHRDLKPANIMIADDKTVRIMDFGVARNYSDQIASEEVEEVIGRVGPAGLPTHRTTSLAGTPAYRCPESRKGVVSERTDIFSLGACLYEALTGTLPYDQGGWSPQSPKPSPLSSFGLTLPPGLNQLVADMLRLDHRKRLPSMQAFIDRATPI